MHYIVSQPWPFPSSLMIACMAQAEDDALRIAAKPCGMLDGKLKRGGDIVQRRWKRMAGRQSVVDVHHHHASTRKRQTHQPVRVFRQDAKAAAVDVQHDRVGRLVDGARQLGSGRRHIDIKLVIATTAGQIGHVIGHIDAVALRTGQRMQLAKSRQPFPAIVKHGPTEPDPQSLVEPRGGQEMGRTM